uniref:Allantoate amidinohydrolase n=1 Tax=Paramormyrops kingsleyae TaxID=1676925 RepID=A0A3B3RF44_9TELE
MATPPATRVMADEPDFLQFNNLACETAGGKVIFATDEWFAPAQNLLKREPAKFIASAFTEFGKWMDGWETRRKRIPGHDWCIIQLGIPGVIHGFDVDTSFFTGNHAPSVSIQAACGRPPALRRSEAERTGAAATREEFEAVAALRSEAWEELVPVSDLRPGFSDTCHNYFSVCCLRRVTHLRLNVYPDGGIARLRVYGVGQRDWSSVSNQERVDLIAMANGGVCLGYSDAHFGHPRNIIGLGRAANMGDGWETARRLDRPRILQVIRCGALQVPGSEWAVFRLGHPGVVSLVEIDTNYFKGDDSGEEYSITLSLVELVQMGTYFTATHSSLFQLKAHHRHFFSGDTLQPTEVVTHVRLIIAPDGGVSRMRLWGHPRPLLRPPGSKL